MVNKIRIIIIFTFFSFDPLLFNFVSFAQTGQDCTQVQCVKIQNNQLWVYSDEEGTYKPFFIKAVGYDPIPIGRHVSDWGWPDPNDPRSSNIYDDPDILNRDFAKLQLMHANAIRIWKGNDTQDGTRFPNKLTDRTMALASKYNLKVIAGFWVNDLAFDSQGNINGRQDMIDRFVAYVNNFKKYPAVLFWAIGNENNYNRLDKPSLSPQQQVAYGAMGDDKDNGFDGHPMSPEQLTTWYALVNDMAQAAHDAEGVNFHPVAIVNGEIHHIGDAQYGTTDEQMTALDIWGVNAYRGKSFDTLFSDYHKGSQKPLWISEFGPDAWHVNDVNDPDNGYEDQDTQADWVGSLWGEIVRNVPVTIGGTVMEYSDEWWKPSEWWCVDPNFTEEENAKHVAECNSNHHHFGHKFDSFPGGFSAEAWFGIMSIAPNPDSPQGPDVMKERKVFYTLQEKWQSDPEKYASN